MYRYSIVLLSVLMLFLSGCVHKSPKPASNSLKPYKDETKYILYALMLSQHHDYKGAYDYFVKLYRHTNNIEYLKYALSLSLKLKNKKDFFSLLEDGLKKYPNDETLNKELIKFYANNKEYEKASDLALKFVRSHPSEENYKFAGSVFLMMKRYKLSYKFFEKAYGINYDEDMLTKLADILYLFLDKKDDAIAYLETHVRLRGCSRKVCYKLLEIYAREKDVNGLISTYKRLYAKYKDKNVAKKIVALLMYQGKKNEAIEFLKKNKIDGELLADIYISLKEFDKAYDIMKKLYDKTKDINYLGRMAIYEYEGSKVKDKALLDSVVKKFEQVIKVKKDPMYLNYYGYLLIDHDMDIKKGIKLVKEALKKDPNSPYYLDSLAWGYYKLGRCKEAYEIMKKVIKMSQDSVVLKHMKSIKMCLKEEK